MSVRYNRVRYNRDSLYFFLKQVSRNLYLWYCTKWALHRYLFNWIFLLDFKNPLFISEQRKQWLLISHLHLCTNKYFNKDNDWNSSRIYFWIYILHNIPKGFFTNAFTCFKIHNCVYAWILEWLENLMAGVNFINILWAAFTLADPESAKKIDNLTNFFALLGSA